MRKVTLIMLAVLLAVLPLAGCAADQPVETTSPPTAMVVEESVIEPEETEPPPAETPTEALPTETPRPTKEVITFEVLYDIQFGVSGNSMLDVYQPQIEGELLPTLLMYVGDGYLKIYMVDIAEFFARQGFAVITFNKALGNYPSREEDSVCIVAWAHANADSYNLDPSKIALVGFSIGGAQAAFAATVDDPASFLNNCPYSLPESSYIDTVVTVAGFFDYQMWIPGAAEDGLIYTYFGPPNAHMEEIEQASAVNWVDGSEPDFYLIHGENDSQVDPQQSVMFADLLEEAGVEVELQMESNLPHDNILTSSTLWLKIKNYLQSRYAE